MRNRLVNWFLKLCVSGFSLVGLVSVSTAWAAPVTLKWAAHYDGQTSKGDYVNAMTADDLGNVYVTGGSQISGSESTYATVKYDTRGQEQWVARYHGPGKGRDVATSMTTDRAGNVYITGQSNGGLSKSDFATIKYDSMGNELWLARFNGPANGKDYAKVIAVDNFGNVYVAGGSQGTGGENDYATVKYDSEGHELWVARYNGSADSQDYANAMVVDDAGNVFVSGWSRGEGSFYDYATVKYDVNGKQLWVARYDGPGRSGDYVRAMVMDYRGNVLVSGNSVGRNGDSDYATVKYDVNGNELWVARYNGSGNSYDGVKAMAADRFGSIYVAGNSEAANGFNDYVTVKYDEMGNELWVARYNGPENRHDGARSVVTDDVGNAYVTGYIVGRGDGYHDVSVKYDANYGNATIKYDRDGNELWVKQYKGQGNSENYISLIAIDGLGNVYVAGWSRDSGRYADYVTLKYAAEI